MEEVFREDFNFGPPSDAINIPDFLKQAEISGSHVWKPSPSSINGWDTFQNLPADEKDAIIEDCSLDGLCSNLSGMTQNQNLYEFIRQYHRNAVETVAAEFGIFRKKDRRKGLNSRDPPQQRKRKKTAAVAEGASGSTPADEENTDHIQYKQMLNSIPLQSWLLHPDAGHYMRPPRAFDANALTTIKQSIPNSESESMEINPKSILITISVYASHASGGPQRKSQQTNPPPSSGSNSTTTGFQRISQHTLLSTQTLGDLYDTIVCPANEIPLEIRRNGGTVTGYDSERTMDTGCLMIIERTVHSDGTSQNDYGQKFLAYTAELAERDPKRVATDVPFVRGAPLHEATFQSLPLRINSPYWMLHQGNCEHILIIDQIRLLHPNDPKANYPLTVQSTPRARRLCKICTRVPATLSIVGDIRLGESPCLLCEPCWGIFGLPKSGRDEDDILVVPVVGGESAAWQ